MLSPLGVETISISTKQADDTTVTSVTHGVAKTGEDVNALFPNAVLGDVYHQKNADGSISLFSKSTGGWIPVTADNSIGWDQLTQLVVSAIGDARSKTVMNNISSDGDHHHVSSADVGQSYNMYYQRSQISSDPLTGTARTLLAELLVNTNGSGNPYAPNAAHVCTFSAHYEGDCPDGTVWVAGGNFEGNAAEGTLINATGAYMSAPKSQLGNNTGSVSIAENAAMSNIGAFSYANTVGVGSNRGQYGAVADMSLPYFWGTRAGAPIPEKTVAVLADAEYAGGDAFALLAIGDARFRGGVVEVPASSGDGHAVNAGELNARQEVYKFDTTADTTRIFASSLDLSKVLFQVSPMDTVVTFSGSDVTVTAAAGEVLTDVTLILQQMAVEVTVI